jgi:S-adenosylmethionine decarboxylase
MEEFDFSGTHVMADIYAIRQELIEDADLIVAGLASGIARSGATLCGMQTKLFEPSGMTAIFLLAESHVSVHTYPEQRSLFFDAFTCGSRCTPETIMEELIERLGPCSVRVKIVPRGEPARMASAPSLTDDDDCLSSVETRSATAPSALVNPIGGTR